MADNGLRKREQRSKMGVLRRNDVCHSEDLNVCKYMISWERPPKVLLGHILNGFKSLLGKKKNKDSVKEGRRGEREKRGKRDQVTTRFKYHLQLAQQAKKCGND